MIPNRSTQHFLGCLTAMGLSIVAPCVLPGTLIGAAAGIIGGLAGNVVTGVLQRKLRERENDPILPDVNHDLLRVIGHGVSNLLGDFCREHRESLGSQLGTVETFSRVAGDAFVDLFMQDPPPGIAPPDAMALLTASSKDQSIPPVGNLEDWQTVVARLVGKCDLEIAPDIQKQIAQYLHKSLWESIRKALKRDFADGGRGYAALHLQFMGEVMSRLDTLTQPQENQAETVTLTRELLEELRQYKQTHTDPKSRQLLDKLTPSDRMRLSQFTQRFDQLSNRLDRRFDQLLDEIRSADRDSRRRDLATHRKLAWVLGAVVGMGGLGAIGYWVMHNAQNQQISATTQIAQQTTQIKSDTAEVRDAIDKIVPRLIESMNEKDQQIGSLRTQLEDSVRRLADAESKGDASASKRLADLKAGGDAQLLADFLDEQINKQQKATIELWRERGAVAFVTGDTDRAEKCLLSILAIEPNDVEAVNALGWVYDLRGDYRSAEIQYKKLLQIAPADNVVLSGALGNLGGIAQKRGDLFNAEKLHRQALDIDRKINNLVGQASDLGNLGLIAYTRGDMESAEKLHRQALEMDRQLNDLEGQANDLGNLGLVLNAIGDLDGALKMQNESLEIDRKLGNLEGQATDLGNLAVLANARGDTDGAEKLHNESLEIDIKIGNLEGQSTDIGNLGNIAMKRGDLDKAEKLFNQALELNRKLERLEGQAIQLRNLGSIAKLRNNFSNARKLWMESQDIYTKIGVPAMQSQLQEWIDALPKE